MDILMRDSFLLVAYNYLLLYCIFLRMESKCEQEVGLLKEKEKKL